MKKIIALLVLLLLPALACAQTLGPANVAYGGGYICSLEAPNGQTLYYVSDRPQLDGATQEEIEMGATDPIVEMVDVNFDGAQDLVIMTASGATNAFYTFFVWDGEQYVMAQNNAWLNTDLPNYMLYPEEKLVYSIGTSGLAGMLHDIYLFRWEGTNLRLLRRAESKLDWERDDILHSIVIDCSDENYMTLWEGELNWQNPGTHGENDYLEAEENALWEGLR